MLLPSLSQDRMPPKQARTAADKKRCRYKGVPNAQKGRTGEKKNKKETRQENKHSRGRSQNPNPPPRLACPHMYSRTIALVTHHIDIVYILPRTFPDHDHDIVVAVCLRLRLRRQVHT